MESKNIIKSSIFYGILKYNLFILVALDYNKESNIYIKILNQQIFNKKITYLYNNKVSDEKTHKDIILSYLTFIINK